MAGHNKWSKIKHKKSVVDEKRSKIFTKITKILNKESSASDRNSESPGLRAAIMRAKKYNMPKAKIERAIASGSDKKISQEKIFYEIYAKSGVVFVVIALTANKNKSAAEIKCVLTKNSLSLSGKGSVLWMFNTVNGELLPKEKIFVNKEADKEDLEKIISSLEDLDDVVEVVHNIK